MSLADKSLTCVECSSEFIFSVGEQEFYAMKGLTNEPKRCPACRSAAKRERYGSGGMSYSSGGGGGYSRSSREMHVTVCAQCGGTAEVPFIPRNDRPVYCSSCFEQMRAR